MWYCLATLGVIATALTIAYFALRTKPPPLPTDLEVIAMLQSVDLGEIPEPLRAAPPRPDVFSFRGYLKQKKHRRAYLPMLLQGRVYRGLCVYLFKDPGYGEMDMRYEYAWLDDLGKLHRVGDFASFDNHAVFGMGSGEVFVPVDAGFALRRPLTIVCSPQTGEHVIYEALLIERDPPPPPEVA